ncbi:MAG: RidA family protein [Gemmatimonadales bacterium]|nr:RidA family protein [Gemmatimonadales bacterium]MDG2241743.1 RidA family protein [Longimicrobiales bacterium]NCG32341.1 RidA family protein [Pseudomonadota bacterium]MBT3500674.1 RidA family protein [Gemmatimonadales bacterium]MBT3773212.1 RidA family protein [Gemmatimonadales bacterium]
MKRSAFVVAFLTAFVAMPAAAQEGPKISHGARAGVPYSPAVQVGNIFWLSGKIGATGETRGMTEGRTAAETHNIMGQFEELLAEHDMDLSNVVRGVVYLTDLDAYAEMNEAYGSYFPTDAPSRVTLEVSNLVAGAAIEISFIAVKN